MSFFDEFQFFVFIEKGLRALDAFFESGEEFGSYLGGLHGIDFEESAQIVRMGSFLDGGKAKKRRGRARW